MLKLKKKNFLLIEFIIVVATVSILSFCILPKFQVYNAELKKEALFNDINSLEKIMKYYNENNCSEVYKNIDYTLSDELIDVIKERDDTLDLKVLDIYEIKNDHSNFRIHYNKEKDLFLYSESTGYVYYLNGLQLKNRKVFSYDVIKNEPFIDNPNIDSKDEDIDEDEKKEDYFNSEEVFNSQKVYTSQNSTFVINNNNTIWTWGNNFYGKLGLGWIDNNQNTPIQVKSLDKNVNSIVNGEDTVYFLMKDKSVYAAGHNWYGNIPTGTFNCEQSPVKISTLGNDVNKIITSGYSTFFIKDSNRIFAAGNNTMGQLGIGSYCNSNIPIEITSLGTNVKKLVTTGESTYALMETGEVFSFGNNSKGQLGLGHNINVCVPTKIPNLNDKIIDIYANKESAYFITEKREILAVGDNSKGQLGLGNFINVNIPTKIPNLSNVQSITLGDYSAYVMIDYEVYSFGYNEMGQLGIGTYCNSAFPVKITSLPTKVKKIYSSYYTTYIIDENSELYSFGMNGLGQLGLNDWYNRNKPTKVTLLKDKVSELRVMKNSTLIITQSNEIWGMGANYDGQLGIGNFEQMIYPVKSLFNFTND